MEAASYERVGPQSTHSLRRSMQQRRNVGSRYHSAATTTPCARRVLGLVLLTVLPACTETDRQNGVTVHPAAANLLSSDRRLATVPSPDSATVQALPFSTPDERAERVFGRAEGSDLDAYGEIVSAAILPTGQVVLLDQSYGLLRLLDGSGVGATVGGPGEGPGEFVEPISVFSHNDSLFVLDRAHALHVFALPAGSPPAYVRTIRLPYEAEDACHAAGGLTVLAAPITYSRERPPELNSSGGTLHRLDGDGRILESFHIPYRSTSPTILQSLYAGRMVCSPADRTITVAYASLGEVHHLAEDGTIRWITRLPDHSYPPLREDPDGLVGPAPDFRGAIDQIRHIASYGDSLIVVSITSRAVFEPGRPSTNRLGILRRHDGTFLGYLTREGVSGVLYGSAEQFLLYGELPHPAVSLRRVSGRSIGRSISDDS